MPPRLRLVLKSWITTILLALWAAPLAAQGWSDMLPKSDNACFARDYDAAHLARHPAQTVESIRAVVTNSIAVTKGDYPGTWFKLVIAYSVRSRSGEVWEFASCDAGPEGTENPIVCTASCYGNSYEFKISIENRNAIRIDLGGQRLPSCRGDVALEHPENRVFVLQRQATAQCSLTPRARRSP